MIMNTETQEEQKLCNKCGYTKDISEFPPGRSNCLPCARQMCRDYKAKNKDKISEYNKKYKAEHTEEISKYNHDYNLEHRNEIQTRQTKYQRERRKTDSNFKMAGTLRNRIKKVVKKEQKSKTTMELLGCDIEFLDEWLSFRFEDDMTMENHGKLWHVDHVIPCAKFDLEDKDEQSKCFHWSNLQPMYGKLNLKKRNITNINEITNQENKIKEFITLYSKIYKGKYTTISYDKLKYL